MSITGTNNPFPCEPVIYSASNTIIAVGTITRNANVFTFSTGFKWKINGVVYENTAPIDITVLAASSGNYRIDNALLNTSNTIELQQGVESTSVALRPVAPNTSIVLTSWNISASSISTPDPAILGSNFLKKDYENSQTFYGPTSAADFVVGLNSLGRNHIILTGTMTGLKGFSLANITSNSSNSEFPHEGKDYFIHNKTGHSVTIKNAGTAVDLNFVSKDGNDIILPNNEIIYFKKISSSLQEFFRSWTPTSFVGVNNTATYTSLPTTVEQVLSSTLIPANTFSDLDAIQLKGIFIKPLENSTSGIKAYINSSNNLIQAYQFYEAKSFNASVSSIIIDSFISIIKNGKIKGSFKSSTGTSLQNIINDTAYNVTEFSFDPAINNYLIITAQLNSASDIITQESVILSKIN